jgi:peptide/nickel transport system substrate-binding protein
MSGSVKFKLFRALVASAFMATMAIAGWPAEQAHAQSQNTLRISVQNAFTTVDPQKIRSSPEFVYVRLVFNALTDFDEKYNVTPELAERWEASADLKSWTFHLRRGVKFHNGRELEAEDVIATYKRGMDPATGSVARSDLGVIEGMEAIDRHTVRFNLNTPYAAFPAVLTSYYARIMPRDAFEQAATKPIGTGPFRFVEHVPGDRIALERNQDYFKGAPKVDRVILRVIPEAASAVAALRSGDLDIIHNLPPEQVANVRGVRNLRVDVVDTGNWIALGMRTDIPPFNNLKLRQAVLALLDKSEVADIAAFGLATPTHLSVPPTSAAYTTRPMNKPDLATARRLLAESGFTGPLSLSIIGEREIQQRIAVAVRDQARRIGLTVDIKPSPADRFFTEVEGRDPFWITTFFMRATPDAMLYPFFHSSGVWNTRLWRYSDANVDKLLDDARTERDLGRQTEMYRQVQNALLDNPPAIPLFVFQFANGVAARVQNLKTTPRWWLDLDNVTLN